jgi:hypothetical protein
MNKTPKSDRERIVAIGLFTADELLVACQALKRVYPVPKDGRFDDLLAQINKLHPD